MWLVSHGEGTRQHGLARATLPFLPYLVLTNISWISFHKTKQLLYQTLDELGKCYTFTFLVYCISQGPVDKRTYVMNASI